MVAQVPATQARGCWATGIVDEPLPPSTGSALDPGANTASCPTADALALPRAHPRQLPYSFVPEAAAYLRQVAPEAPVRLIREALVATSQFPEEGGEPELIDLRAAVQWLWTHQEMC